MKLLKEHYVVGKKVKIKNSSPLYNGRIATIYSIRKNSPSRLITVKLDNGRLQQFEPFQLEEVLGESIRFLKESLNEITKKFDTDQDLLDYIEGNLITSDNPIFDFGIGSSIELESPNFAVNAWFAKPSFNVNPYPIIQVDYKDRIIFHREGAEGSAGRDIFSDDMFNAMYDRIQRDEDPANIGMKRLKEAFGESEELNTFVAQIERRFRKYYEVSLKLNGNESRRYFAFEEAARKYYDGLVQEANNDIEYYDGANIEFKAVEVLRDEEELDSILIDKEDDTLDESVAVGVTANLISGVLLNIVDRIINKFGGNKKSKWIDYKKHIIEITPDKVVNIYNFNGEKIAENVHTVKAAKLMIKELYNN